MHSSSRSLTILLIFALLVSSAHSFQGRNFPLRMSTANLKYSIPAKPIPTNFGLKSPRGANLATRVWPTRNKNPPRALCLIVHGGGWHSGYFEDLAGGLTKNGIFCASYDQVNSGYSDPEPDTPAPGVVHVQNFDCFVQDVFAAIEWMQKEAGTADVPLFLFGESFGALEVGWCAFHHDDNLLLSLRAHPP